VDTIVVVVVEGSEGGRWYGEPVEDVVGGVRVSPPVCETALTGRRMHRRTCRFRLDATPIRRPHVSHTKAIKENERFQAVEFLGIYLSRQYGRVDATHGIT
jgi:hypothetical protein